MTVEPMISLFRMLIMFMILTKFKIRNLINLNICR